uniref:Predicted nucleic acid-binding protein, contains PIN domain n=1 Tax=Candidatus Kentrum sp. LFY TaxID=2126342 RepID=A0A450UPE1_9GAMM|nr:MAG: Predicted nucleic acid-binding protein, contains PIN domain [Candidatus Kentron sp. LFY]VFJ94424.1 MAG: Predicted nucleic acid-binding protein, contains PIN domain [Candidatus Kentron sp. LFY]
MKQICIDTHLLIWGVQGHASAGQEEMVPRTKTFFQDCRKSKLRVMVPSIVVGEFLMGIEINDHVDTVKRLQNSFILQPYDSLAAVVFARLWRERKESGLLESIRSESPPVTRSESKADAMIVATAIAAKAGIIYSHDMGLKKFADKDISVIEMPRKEYQVNAPLQYPPAQ